MLTRLRVRGFKNLADVDVSFGPFTCIAGANGVGKSNLFDAITFLSALADRPLMEAAKSVRDERNHSTDVRSLFLSLGAMPVDEISFEAEMLIPGSGRDDLGQEAEAKITFVQYGLALRFRRDQEAPSAERLEITREELRQINVGDALKHLQFPHSRAWRGSVAGGRRTAPFLSTEGDPANLKIKLHQDGRSGKPREYLASSLPRTVLSSTNAAESPTALLARREMQSWRLLQLEPSSLRNSDFFNAPTHVGTDGSHLASTLYHLARMEMGNGESRAKLGGGEGMADTGNGKKPLTGPIYAKVVNQLSQLVDDLREVRVDVDQQRELLTLQVRDRHGNLHAARALSDGTLRFLALAILEQDPGAQGLLCFEEPENGIHPARIGAMLTLLKGLCVDPQDPKGPDNPLRQVIVNTHSPAVVGLVEDADLLVAEPREAIVGGQRCRAVGFAWLGDTWRDRAFPDVGTVPRGTLGAYLNPLAIAAAGASGSAGVGKQQRNRPRRVKDRDDLQDLRPYLPGFLLERE
ncbi:MAG: AAA family ATPase [Thermoguttaceae bacterium]|jgi:predicted ATPase